MINNNKKRNFIAWLRHQLNVFVMLLAILMWYNPLALIKKFKPPQLIIDKLNYFRNNQDAGCFYLVQLSKYHFIRDPYSYPMKMNYRYRKWHLITKKIA